MADTESLYNFEYRDGKKYCITQDKTYEMIDSKDEHDISGNKYNRLTVIGRVHAPSHIVDTHSTYWLCLCDCGTFVTVRRNGLTSGKTRSCGCYKKELNSQKRKSNIYDLSGEYGIGYAGNTGTKFYFDLEDYDLIKQYYWTANKNGYIMAWKNGEKISMHRLVCGVTDSTMFVDHRYHNNYDNRKSKLRITSCHNNTMNEKLAINNTSGTTGVSFENGKWRAYIWFNGKTIHLGSYDDKQDAISARIEGESRYFQDFGYHNSMKEEGL